MASFNFYLDKKHSEKPTYIMFSVSDSGNRYRIATGEKVLPKYWNDKKQQVKRTYTGSLELNAFLTKFSEDVLAILRDAKTKNEYLTNQDLKARLNAEKAPENKPKGFFEVYDLFIEQGKHKLAPATIKVYYTLLHHLKGFIKKSRYNLEFETVNTSFKDKFTNYLIKHPRLNDSSIQKMIGTFKRFMNFATDYGYNDNFEYQRFKAKRKPIIKVHLTVAELQKIADLDLSNKPSFERVRDMFLFCCETSLRYSDLANLKPINIQNMSIDGKEVFCLNLVAKKTRGEIFAPLSDTGKQILYKYQSSTRKTCFPVISGQKYNDYIKEICKLAGIDSPVEVVNFIGNERIEEIKPKYEMISSHSARRTFCTLFFERGGTIEQCMMFTGHKDAKELKSYWIKTKENRVRTAMGFNPIKPIIKMEKVG